jgi:lysophospholipase L1-like esterase
VDLKSFINKNEGGEFVKETVVEQTSITQPPTELNESVSEEVTEIKLEELENEVLDVKIEVPTERTVTEKSELNFVGSFNYIPDPIEYNEGSIYKNVNEGVAYIRKGLLWEELVRDGKPGRDAARVGGSGVGVAEVKSITGMLGIFDSKDELDKVPTTNLKIGTTATLPSGPVTWQGAAVGWASSKTVDVLNAMLNAGVNAINNFAAVGGVATWAEASAPSPWRVPDAAFMTRKGVSPEAIKLENSWANCVREAPYANGSSYMAPVSSVAQRVYTVAFRTDAPAVVIQLSGQHNSTHGVTVLVDGKIVFSGVTVAAGGSTAYEAKFFSLTFAVTGVMHLVKIVMDGTYSCDGVYVSNPIQAAAENLYSCRAAPDALPTLMISSDSFGAGTGATIPPMSCASLAALQLGLDPLVVANGGTGYIANGPSSNWPTHAPADVLNHNADAYLFLLGVNDAAQPVAAIEAAVRNSLLMVRAVSQIAPIFVCGPWNPRTAVAESVKTAIFAGCAGIPGVYTIDNYAAGWQTGDGRNINFTGALVGATSATMTTGWSGTTGSYSIRFSDGTVKSGVTLTNGSTAISWAGSVTASANAGAFTVAGNSTLYVGPDGTHPPQAGHTYLSARIADGVFAAIRKALGLSGK